MCETLAAVAGPETSVRFRWAAASIAAALIVACVCVAAVAGFSREDFHHLILVRSPEFTWWSIFFPLEHPHHFLYRPVGYDGFFKVGYPLFGLHATPYLLSSLVLHFATGAVAFRIARLLGYAAAPAVTTALLCVSMFPALTQLFRAVMFNYACAVFLLTTSLWLFYASARDDRAGLRVASFGVFVLALLSNEFVVGGLAALALLSLHADGFQRTPGAAMQTARRLAPFVLVVAVYLPYRLVVLDTDKPHLYDMHWGPNIARNLIDIPATAVGGPLAAWGALAIVAGILGLAAASAGGRSELRSRFAGRAVVSIGWLVGVLVPYLGLRNPGDRFSIPVQVPLALGFGAVLDLAWSLWGARRRGVLEAAFLACVLVAIPYAGLRRLYVDPDGALPRQLVHELETTFATHPGRRVRIRVGAPERADAETTSKLLRMTWQGAVLHAMLPERRLRMEVVEVPAGRPPTPCAGCIELDLTPQGTLVPALP